jgi:hypothetical protein
MSSSGDAFIFETISNTIFDGGGTPVTLNGTFEVEFDAAGTIDGVSNISLVATSSDLSTNSSTFTSGTISNIGIPAPYPGSGDTVNEIHVSASFGSFQQAYLDFNGEEPTSLIDGSSYGHYSSIGYPGGLESIDAASGGSAGIVTSTALPLAPVSTDTYVLTTYNNVVFDNGTSNEPVTLSGTMLTEYDPNGTLIGVSDVNLTASDPSDTGSNPSNLTTAMVNIAGTPGQTGDAGINEISVTANGGSFPHVNLDFYGENPGTLATSPSHYSDIGYATGQEAQTGGPASMPGNNTDAVQDTFLLATISNVIFAGDANNGSLAATLSGTFEEEFNPGGTLVGVSNINLINVSNGNMVAITQTYDPSNAPNGFTAGDPDAGGYAAINQINFQSGGADSYSHIDYIDLLGEEPDAVFAGGTGNSNSSDSGTGYQPINGYNGFGSSGVITYEQVAPDIETATCYLRGTKLLTPAGEIAVENLAIGDTLITRFGGYQRIKWIGRQSYARPFIRHNREKLPVRIEAGALGPNLPKRDLLVSPGHSMLIAGVLILAKNLVNGVTITQTDAPEQIDYFQPEFETHDCVMAEGAWSETYADTPGLRAQFHNAAEFYELFPNHQPIAEQRLCAPRPQGGRLLDAALRPIIARAQTGTAPGPLRGYIDALSETGLEGWAQDLQHPELPVLLEILIAGRPYATILACDYRADLAAAGIGRGFAKFACPLPAGVTLADIRVRRLSDRAELRAPREAARRSA